jgi:SAM-dependent methyltransferase
MKISAFFNQKRKCWNIIKKHFPIYSNKNNVFHEIINKYLLSSKVILDAGCGSGRETPINYTEKVKLAIGLDLSSAISLNRSIHKKIIGDVSYIPLRDSSIDLVVCQELIEHLNSPLKFFQEVSRVLKPQGIFIVMTPNLWSWRSLISKCTPYWFHLLMNKQVYDIDTKNVFPTFYRANSYITLKRLLRSANVEIIDYVFFEGSPRTLTFSVVTTYLEIMYTNLIRRFDALMWFRETIITVSRKK